MLRSLQCCAWPNHSLKQTNLQLSTNFAKMNPQLTSDDVLLSRPASQDYLLRWSHPAGLCRSLSVVQCCTVTHPNNKCIVQRRGSQWQRDVLDHWLVEWLRSGWMSLDWCLWSRQPWRCYRAETGARTQLGGKTGKKSQFSCNRIFCQLDFLLSVWFKPWEVLNIHNDLYI